MGPTILSVGFNFIHPSLPAQLALNGFLRAQPGVSVRRAHTVGVLARYDLAEMDALVLYLHAQRISPGALAAFEAYVEGGGGVLAVHSASASFKGEDRYYDVLGGRFAEHGPVQTFGVQRQPAGPPFDGIDSFSVRDELYRHEYDAGNTVHFATEVGGALEPVVWTRMHGSGRVCYCSLGHRAGVFTLEPVQAILARGLRWACGEAVRA